MKHAKVHELMLRNNETIKQIFTDALLNSFSHSCQIFSAEKGYNRDKSDNSFLETLDKIIGDKAYRHITILYRDIVNENYDLKHWEFGACSKELYLTVCVKPELAKLIFETFDLKTIDY